MVAKSRTRLSDFHLSCTGRPGVRLYAPNAGNTGVIPVQGIRSHMPQLMKFQSSHVETKKKRKQQRSRVLQLTPGEAK